MSNDDELEVRPDGRKSRHVRTLPARNDVDPDDVATVDEKIAEFWRRHPDGAILPNVEVYRDVFDVPTYTVTAHVWKKRTLPDTLPDATAHASCTRGVGDEFSAIYALETAESKALGRALRYLGITGRNQENTP